MIIFVAIVAIIFSPYLLAIDFVKYSPLVLIIWFLSIAYYLWIKRRVDQQALSEHEGEEEGEGEEEDEEGKKDVSRETSSGKNA